MFIVRVSEALVLTQIEAVQAPADSRDNSGNPDGSLNCAGYGSSVTVTATFGMVAAGEAIAQMLAALTLPIA